MTAKKFDCVQMMHRGAEEVQKKLRSKSKKEEVAFWRERSRKLTQRQGKTQGKGKREAIVSEKLR